MEQTTDVAVRLEGQEVLACAAEEPAAAKPPKKKDFEYMVLCPAGFETALANELRELGCRRVRPLKGCVAFFGDLREGYRACLWSRLASRVLLVMRRVDRVLAMDDLYDRCLDLPWERQIGPKATIAVEVRGSTSEIRDRRFAALRVKDAICDHMRDVRGERPYVDAEQPDVRVVCSVREGRATLSIDLGGGPLVDHGYRVPARNRSSAGHAGFLREDMAALMLALGGWGALCAEGAGDSGAPAVPDAFADGLVAPLLVDPLGTSPVLAVEAACMACDRAPRLTRRHWGFTGWEGHDAQVWADELAEAQARFDRGRADCGRCAVVACTDGGLRAEAAEMARRAGVAQAIEVRACGPAMLDLGSEPLERALVACALPDESDGARLGDLPARLASMAALTRTAPLAQAGLVTLAASDLLASVLGLEPETRCNVINGRDNVSVLVFPSAARAFTHAEVRAVAGAQASVKACRPGDEEARVPRAAEPAALHEIALPGGGTMSVLVAASDQFAARLAKVAKQRAKWARKAGVSCYRVYDADLPDYAVSIDLYQGTPMTPGRWLVMSEYAAPREIDEGVAARRLADALAIAPRVLDVDPENVFLKVRRRGKGGAQYSEMGNQNRTALVEEGGLVFEVNFSDRLDTGLFLDHRLVRSMIREQADRTRFLNLFAYTGTASCYAADGGAFQTTTVDISGNYLAWARRNMEQNGFGGKQHEFVQTEVMEWVSNQRHTANRWDLIYVDPPTFSNSAKMRKRMFDVQEDHVELLIGASRLLVRGGHIIFSCNLRGFKPDTEALLKAGVVMEDITPQTIPVDFERNAKIHHCYIVRRTE